MPSPRFQATRWRCAARLFRRPALFLAATGVGPPPSDDDRGVLGRTLAPLSAALQLHSDASCGLVHLVLAAYQERLQHVELRVGQMAELFASKNYLSDQDATDLMTEARNTKLALDADLNKLEILCQSALKTLESSNETAFFAGSERLALQTGSECHYRGGLQFEQLRQRRNELSALLNQVHSEHVQREMECLEAEDTS